MLFHRSLLQGKSGAADAVQYLSIKFLADNGTIKFTPNSSSIKLEYIVQGVDKWIDLNPSGNAVTIQYRKGTTKFIAGDIVSFRAKVSKTTGASDYSNSIEGAIGTFSVSVNYNVFGNFTSIIKDGGITSFGTTTLAGLFKGQTKLIQIGNEGKGLRCLPVANVASKCYYEMFSGCTALTNTPEFTINSAAANCCENMFYSCTSLTNASGVNINDASGNACFKNAFYNCKKLINAPIINNPLCGVSCFESTFASCSGLIDVSNNINIGDMIPQSAGIKQHACYLMFKGCTALTTPPKISTMTTAEYCFESMFNNCTSLSATPALPADDLADYCYYYMFNGGYSSETVQTPVKGLISAGKIGTNGVNVGKYSCYRMFAGCVGSNNTAWSAPIMHINSIKEYGCCEMFRDSHVNGDSAVDSITIDNLAAATYSYSGMFAKCSKLTVSPIHTLPGNIGSSSTYCFDKMYHSSALIVAPKLTLTSAAGYCCQYMFSWCSSLKDISQIDIQATASHSHYRMFISCSALKTSNLLKLSASTVKTYCYSEMFSGCTGITTLPNNFLPAKKMTERCYESMFGKVSYLYVTIYDKYYGGTISSAGLQSLPADLLPATTLAPYCYHSMFSGCPITEIPSGPNDTSFLPATKLDDGCYYSMFYECTKLRSTTKHLISHVTPDNMAPECYAYMFYGCTELRYNGTYNGKTYTIPTLNNETSQTLQSGCYYYMFSGCTNFNPSGRGEYLNDNNRSTYLPTYQSLAPECYAYMFNSTALRHYPLLPVKTLKTHCYNNMLSNCNFTDTVIPDDILNISDIVLANYCYSGMFQGSNVTYIPSLPATTLAEGCYYNMFKSCTKLASIPSLPATTLVSHCYYGMFGSTNITDGLIENVYNSISNITSLAPYCYAYMFSNCNKLTSVPKLPATIMQSHCYDNMFYKCNNAGFNTTPELKATNLADYCYNKMFCGCTYLKDASNVIIDPTNNTIPDNCCNSMFDGCSNLNIGYPHIADKEYSVGKGSFAYMFKSCKFDTNNNFEPKFTISTVRNIYFSSDDGPCEQMFYGSNITNAGGITISTTKSASSSYNCCYRMFYNCTNLINPPILSATNLSTDCYYQMFYGCTSLEKAPDLPATTLQSNCYYQMFYNCSKLKEVFANFTTSIYNAIQADDGDISYTYPYTSSWLDRTPNSSDCKFIHNSNATWVESINANNGALRGISTVPKYWTMTPQTE